MHVTRPPGRLTHRKPFWRRPDDRGAVATVFTLLLAGGVLLGVMAIVVDIGQVYVERDELQSGADAAALGVARACAAEAAECDSLSGLIGIVQRYANDNASDSAAEIGEVCGRVPGVLPECSDDPANLTACLGAPPTADPYVEVRLSTRMADGSLVLPPVFAQSMSGGFNGVSVGTCARASWAPGALTILAVTATICQFDEATNGGTNFGDATAPQLADEYIIQFWTGSVEPCDSNPEPPWLDPNQAGFLDGGGTRCQIGVANDGVVTGSFIGFQPFALAPASCENRVRQARADGEVIYLPIHDGRTGDDVNPQFRHIFVAPFLVTAFQFGAPVANPDDPSYDPEAHSEPSFLSGRHPCDVVRYRCVSGMFVGEPVPISELTLESVIRLIG